MRLIPYIIPILLLMFAVPVHADLMVEFIAESSLPYEYSPNNIDNSSNNIDNSIGNIDNASGNIYNSEGNLDNSPFNLDNGASGNKRLLLRKDGQLYRVGYYVKAENGVINFFSTKGARLFYNTGKGPGIFHGKKGFFCGVLAIVEGELKMLLTEKGKQALMLTKT